MTSEEFERLWPALRERLYRRVLWRTGCSYAADTLVGIVLVSCLKSRERLPAEGEGGFSLRVYCRFILKRQVNWWLYGRTNRENRLPCVSLDAENGALVEALAMEHAAPYQQARLSDLEAIQYAKSRLRSAGCTPRECRIALHRLRGATLREIAVALGCSHQNVSLQIAKIIRMLEKTPTGQEADNPADWDAEYLFSIGAGRA